MAEAIENHVSNVLSYPILPAGWDHAGPEGHLARELHDGVAGELSTLLLDLERFRDSQAGRHGVLAEISRVQDQLRFVLGNVRQLLTDQRGIASLDPDFIGAFRRSFVQRFAERTGLRIHVSVSRRWPCVIPTESATNLRRILQEALNNVDRHSGATSALIRFSVPAAGDAATITVSDNGRGYPDLDTGWQAGLGLVGIEERATLLGARVKVCNRRRGGGVLTVSLPRRCLGL